jgi:hypothetical protein
MGMGELNLAKGMVWPDKSRSRVYRLMLVYLLVSASLLTLAALHATAKISDGVQYHRQSRAIQQQFEKEYPGQGLPDVCADRLREAMQRNAKKAVEINQAMPPTTWSMLPVLELLLSQHDGSRIRQLAFAQQDQDSQKPVLELNLILPARAGCGASPAFLRNWPSDPSRRPIEQVTSVVPVSTERGSVMNEEVLMMKYKLTFKEP